MLKNSVFELKKLDDSFTDSMSSATFLFILELISLEKTQKYIFSFGLLQ